MPLQKEQSRKKRPVAVTLRLSLDALDRLRALSSTYNQSQADIVESLLTDACQEAMKEYPAEFKKALIEERKKRG